MNVSTRLLAVIVGSIAIILVINPGVCLCMSECMKSLCKFILVVMFKQVTTENSVGISQSNLKILLQDMLMVLLLNHIHFGSIIVMSARLMLLVYFLAYRFNRRKQYFWAWNNWWCCRKLLELGMKHSAHLESFEGANNKTSKLRTAILMLVLCLLNAQI